MFQSFFAYWHINQVCQVLWQSEKNWCRSSELKNFNDTRT